MAIIKGTAFSTDKDIDNKQRINLSAFALETINEDMIAFGNPKNTTIINTIILNGIRNELASIHSALEKEQTKLEATLLDLRIDEREKDEVIRYLVKQKKKELLEHAESYESGESRSIRLQNEVIDYLVGNIPGCMEGGYYKSRTKYLKAIIEEYCAKPYSERELIYFDDKVRKIREAIRENKKIAAKTAGGKYCIYPYDIICDKKTMYNYLVGYSIRLESDDEKRPMSMRISADNQFEVIRSGSGKLKEAEKKSLRELIEKRGVQFMVGEEEEIRVVLTDAGIAQYNRQLHLRPVYKAKENNEYVFSCTPLQAEVYFSRFGKEALIKEPEYLRERMKTRFSEAYDSYCKKK